MRGNPEPELYRLHRQRKDYGSKTGCTKTRLIFLFTYVNNHFSKGGRMIGMPEQTGIDYTVVLMIAFPKTTP